MKLTFCIIHYYKEHELSQLVNQLLSQSENNFEIAVLDNGNNGTLCLPAAVNYNKSDFNMGVIRSRQWFISNISADYYVFLDDDLKVPEVFVQKLIKSINESSFDLMAFKVYDAKYNVRRFEFISNSKVKKKTYKFLGGACCIKKGIATEMFLDLHDSFYGMEEYELANILYMKNATMIFDPNIYVHHLKSEPSILIRSNRYNSEHQKAIAKIRIILKYNPVLFCFLPILLWCIKCVITDRTKRLTHKQFFLTLFRGNSLFK